MRLHRPEQLQKLPLSPGDGWAFSYEGMLVSHRLRFGVAVEITHVEAPLRFVDEQRSGAYRFLHHRHPSREIDGGVEMRDLPHSVLPRGAGAAELFFVPALRDIIACRREVLERTFGAWSAG